MAGQIEMSNLSGDLINSLGLLASAFVFLAFSMKRMLALRLTAIASNVAFLAYGIAAGLIPIIVLHGALLPLNLLRLMQMLQRVRKVRVAAELPVGEDRFEWLLEQGRMRTFAPGTILFRKGDPSGNLYMIVEGEVLLPELGLTLGAGTVLGEIGLFAEDGQRLASAQAVGAVKAVEVSKARVMELYFDNPGFAYGLVKLITRRLNENFSRTEAVQTAPAGADDPRETPKIDEASA